MSSQEMLSTIASGTCSPRRHRAWMAFVFAVSIASVLLLSGLWWCPACADPSYTTTTAVCLQPPEDSHCYGDVWSSGDVNFWVHVEAPESYHLRFIWNQRFVDLDDVSHVYSEPGVGSETCTGPFNGGFGVTVDVIGNVNSWGPSQCRARTGGLVKSKDISSDDEDFNYFWVNC